MAFYYRNSRGFTLAEMAVVLSIVGLLALGALQGRSMIDRATARTLAAELRNVKTMVAVYRERFKAVPGDDPRAHHHLSGALPSTQLQGDGRIGLSPMQTWVGTPTIIQNEESGLFWQHVRLAQLADGDPGKGYAYNAVHGRLGISSNRNMPTRPEGIGGLYRACTSTIEGRLAQLIDIDLDDGDATSGQVWAAQESAHSPVVSPTAPTAYVKGKTYTVCLAV